MTNTKCLEALLELQVALDYQINDQEETKYYLLDNFATSNDQL